MTLLEKSGSDPASMTPAIGEERFSIPGPTNGLDLALTYLPAEPRSEGPRRAVIYVHGATFPSALSIAYRFDGRSWRDALSEAGFDVWGLDFNGFGEAGRYPEMGNDAAQNSPLCLAVDAAEQLATAARFVLAHHGLGSLSLIAHSWGGMVAARFAGEHPALVDRLVLFGPLACRTPSRYAPRPNGPAWRIVTVEDQWNRFIEDVPANEPPVLARQHFDAWALAYLDTDQESRSRDPVGVKIPSGPFVEILRAWHGELPYDPSAVRAPVAIIRGEWDGLCTDADARWLFDAFDHAPVKRDIKIGRGTHLMHLESMRPALWQQSIAFLRGGDVAATPQ